MTTKKTAYDSQIMGSVPYFNDFNEAKKFLQVMFKPGYAVQARELAQAQSILQNQIERFGDHIFANGSVVLGGAITEVASDFLRISPDTELSTENLARIVGQKITATTIDDAGATTETEARIVATSPKSTLSNDPYQVVFVQYLTPGTYQENIRISTTGTNSLGLSFTTLSGQTAPGVGRVSNLVSVNEGVYYVDGYFTQNDKQSFAAYSTHSNNYRDYTTSDVAVGFESVRSVVTEGDDSTLRDPSFGYSNYNSPGADRFKVSLNLTQRGLTGSGTAGYEIADPTDFVELVRVIGGNTTRIVKYPNYAELEKTLARRTFDESGHYTVEPFPLEVDSYLSTFGINDPSKFGVIIGPGKGYIKGFEFETTSENYLENDFPTVEFTQSGSSRAPRGAYVRLNGDKFGGIKVDSKQIFKKSSRMYFYDADGNQLGSFNPLYISAESGAENAFQKLFITSVKLNVGARLTQIRTISSVDTIADPAADITGNSASHITLIAADGDEVVLAGSARAIFEVSKSGAIRNANPARLPKVSPFVALTNSSGIFTVNADINREFIGAVGNRDGALEAPQVLVDDDNGVKLVRVSNFTISNNQSEFTGNLGTAFANRRVVLFAPMSNTDKTAIRTKSLSGTLTATNLSANTPGVFVMTGVVDVKEIISITQDGVDVTDKFVLDDGQREYAYEFSRLLLKPDATLDDPNGQISVSYVRYLHSGNDGPFTADSYLSIPRADIPSFNGKKLPNFVDWRPRRQTDGSLNYAQGTAPNDDCDPYTPPQPPEIDVVSLGGRIDSVVVTPDRTFKIIKGVAALEPEPPVTSPNDMEIYRLHIPGDATSSDEVRIEYINNQRFTMKEIGEIETAQQFDSDFNYKRSLINNVISRTNASGSAVPIALSGVYADELAGHANADVTRANYNASIDPLRNRMYPPFVSQSIEPTTQENGTIFLESSGGQTTSDGIFLPTFSSAVFASQIEITEDDNLEELNPFGAVDYYGTLKISPFCINYWDENIKPKVSNNLDGQLNNWELDIRITRDNQIAGRNRGFGTTWRDWELHWFGTKPFTTVFDFVDPNERVYRQDVKTAFVTRVLSRRMVKNINNKIVDISIRPYIPESTIRLEATGLRPSSRVYVFMDSEAIGDLSGYVVSETGTLDISSVTIPSGRFTVGKKHVFLMDVADGEISRATTSADEYFYAQRLIDTEVNSVSYPRPPSVRRRSSNSDSLAFDSYGDLFNSEQSVVLNSESPLLQRFNVNPTEFPNGIFIPSVDLFFNEVSDAATPVTVSISPVVDGVPSDNIIMPFARVTKAVSTIAERESVSGEIKNAETFEFSSPVYLAPGEYALSVSTNDLSLSAFVQNLSSVSTDARFGPLYLPNNNGTNTPYFNRRLCCVIRNCAFSVDNAASATVQLSNVDSVNADALYVSNAPNTYSNFTNNITISNTTVEENSSLETVRNLIPAEGTVTFKLSNNSLFSTLIDPDQVSLLAVEAKINNALKDAPTGFLEPPSEMAAVDLNAPGIFRYYSKIVELDSSEPADDVVVFVDGVFTATTKVYVFVKTLDSSTNLEDTDYIQLFPGGKATQAAQNFEGALSIPFQTYRQDPDDDIDPGDAPEIIRSPFSRYLFKVVVSDTQDGIQEGCITPYVTFIGAAPVRTQAGALNFSLGIPTGTVLPVAQQEGVVPVGWLACDGQAYNPDDYPNLFASIGYKYGNSGVNFRVPDLRSRVVLGEGAGEGLTARTLGQEGGTEKVMTHNHVYLDRFSPDYNSEFDSDDEGDSSATSDAGTKFLSTLLGTQDVTIFEPFGPNYSISKEQQRGIGIDLRGSDNNGGIQNVDFDATEQMPPYLVLKYIIKT